MKLAGTVFLAAHGARSRAYAQALAAAGLAPEHTFLFGPKPPADRTWPRWPANVPAPAGLFVPNLDEPVETTAQKAGWQLTELQETSVNAEGVRERLRSVKPRVVIYSGLGGELVRAEVLAASGAFLHVHSGWLPDKRGSTTLYYSLLEDEQIGVTALLLDPAIDTGPFLARKRFAFPPPGVDVDHLYDGAVRANVVTEVARHLATHGELPPPTNQVAHHTPYYIIHPVLKHLALLRPREGR